MNFNKTRYLIKQQYVVTSDATFYRAELKGIYATFLMIKHLGADGLRQICDNKEAVNKVKETFTPNHMAAPEEDIILACKEVIYEMQIKPDLN